VRKKKRIVYEQPEIKEVNALLYEIQFFTDAVQYNKKPVVSGEDGLKALKVASAIIEKIENTKIQELR
jgi:predicted dehydrogenase